MGMGEVRDRIKCVITSGRTSGPVVAEDAEDHQANDGARGRRAPGSLSVRSESLVDGDGCKAPVNRVNCLEERAGERDDVDRGVLLGDAEDKEQQLLREGYAPPHWEIGYD